MPSLADATAATFRPHIGTTFALGDAALELVGVDELGPAPTPELRAPFVLRFTGEVALGQGIHALSHPTLGELEIFLVQTGPTDYEAVFG